MIQNSYVDGGFKKKEKMSQKIIEKAEKKSWD